MPPSSDGLINRDAAVGCLARSSSRRSRSALRVSTRPRAPPTEAGAQSGAEGWSSEFYRFFGVNCARPQSVGRLDARRALQVEGLANRRATAVPSRTGRLSSRQWRNPFTALYTKWKQRSWRRSRSASVASADRDHLGTADNRALLREAARELDPQPGVGRCASLLFCMGAGRSCRSAERPRDAQGRARRRVKLPGGERYRRTEALCVHQPVSHLSIERRLRLNRFRTERFICAVTRHRIVKATDLWALRSLRREMEPQRVVSALLRYRYIAYAKAAAEVEPRGAKPAYNSTTK